MTTVQPEIGQPGKQSLCSRTDCFDLYQIRYFRGEKRFLNYCNQMLKITKERKTNRKKILNKRIWNRSFWGHRRTLIFAGSINTFGGSNSNFSGIQISSVSGSEVSEVTGSEEAHGIGDENRNFLVKIPEKISVEIKKKSKAN